MGTLLSPPMNVGTQLSDGVEMGTKRHLRKIWWLILVFQSFGMSP